MHVFNGRVVVVFALVVRVVFAVAVERVVSPTTYALLAPEYAVVNFDISQFL